MGGSGSGRRIGLDWIGLVEMDGIYNSGLGLQQNLHENTSSKRKDSKDRKEEVWKWMWR